MAWLPAVDGYEIALADRKIVCRSSSGKSLKSVPKSVRESEAALGLRQLAEWLDRHDAACRAEVEGWMVRSLPVPAAAVAAVWPDPSWRSILHDAVVAPVDAAGRWQLDRAGFLRDAPPPGRLGILNLDGESVRLDVSRVVLPHPVLLDDLDELREFAVDLGVQQGLQQLFREIWLKPADAAGQTAELGRYAGGRFAQLRHLTGRATSLGYAVRGGYAVRRVWEAGRAVDACVWLGADDPAVEAETGDLTFVSVAGGLVPLPDVGPVAWSEGMRMAAGLYAGRVVTEDEA